MQGDWEAPSLQPGPQALGTLHCLMWAYYTGTGKSRKQRQSPTTLPETGAALGLWEDAHPSTPLTPPTPWLSHSQRYVGDPAWPTARDGGRTRFLRRCDPGAESTCCGSLVTTALRGLSEEPKAAEGARVVGDPHEPEGRAEQGAETCCESLAAPSACRASHAPNK